MPGAAWVFTDAVKGDRQPLMLSRGGWYAPTTRLEGFLNRFRFITPERFAKRAFTTRGLPNTSTGLQSSSWVGYRVFYRGLTLGALCPFRRPFLELGLYQFT